MCWTVGAGGAVAVGWTVNVVGWTTISHEWGAMWAVLWRGVAGAARTAEVRERSGLLLKLLLLLLQLMGRGGLGANGERQVEVVPEIYAA
jgi:hypothetical protein